MRDCFIATLSTLAADDPDLMLLTADLGFGVLNDFAERFPRQYLNVGVAEQNLTGLAAGLALCGKHVFTYSIANFPTLRCLEQIRNDVCYHDLPVTIVSIGGGLSYGPLGFSHQATEDLAIMRALPTMTVVAPGDDEEARDATIALSQLNSPSYLRLDRVPVPRNANEDVRSFQIGRMAIVREGDPALLIVSTGAILATALDAASHLEALGIGVTVASCHTLKPFDTETLNAQIALGCRMVVTVEEHSVIGGLGSAVADSLSSPDSYASLPVLRCGLPDVLPTIVGSQSFLRQQFGLTGKAIAAKVRSTLRSFGALN